MIVEKKTIAYLGIILSAKIFFQKISINEHFQRRYRYT